MMKVKAGEIQTLGLLYERYKKRLFGFFYQMNKNVDLSEDLVQNVFIRVLKYKHTFHEESKFITWIFQIARNELYDDFKKQKKENHNDIDDYTYQLNGDKNIELDIEIAENKRKLEQAIANLSPEKKELIVLSKLKELKYKEVGEIIGCTEGAARTKVHRAMHELKQLYLNLEHI